MQSPLPQLTTFLLLSHLVFGCCFHHAHACEANCCSEPAATAAACPCSTHVDSAEAHSNKAGHSVEGCGHGERHRCSGVHCSFVGSRSCSEDLDGLVASGRPCEVIAVDDRVDSWRLHPDCIIAPHISTARPSLRTHLALRVLLL